MDQNMMMFLLLYLLLQRQSGQTSSGSGTSALGSSNVLVPTVVGFSDVAAPVRGLLVNRMAAQAEEQRAQLATENSELGTEVTSLEAKVAELETAVKDCDAKWLETATELFNFCITTGITVDKLSPYPRLLELYKLGTPPNF